LILNNLDLVFGFVADGPDNVEDFVLEGAVENTIVSVIHLL
jgi:hypothetical protein